jgi:hypothetical protein
MSSLKIFSVLALGLILVGGAGCALPKLPGLPTIGSIKEATGLGSTGDTAKDAVLLANNAADAWGPGADLIDVRGTRIDTGGRDHGLTDGQWRVEYQLASKKSMLQVNVINGKVSGQAELPYQDGSPTLERGLGGLIDSSDAISKANLGAHSYTVILRGTTPGPRYDVLGEGAGTAATLDARTGAAVAE